MKKICIENKQLYILEKPGMPLLYMHCFEINENLLTIDPNCSLILISGIDWDNDLTDSNYIPIFNRIRHQIESSIDHSWVGMIGYSLAGMFTLKYALQSDMQRYASVSGSLWYEGFKDYVLHTQFAHQPEKIYLSLGSKEKKTRHPLMRHVQEDTQAIFEHYQELGIDTIFELNPGNHFTDEEKRIEKAIEWILN